MDTAHLNENVKYTSILINYSILKYALLFISQQNWLEPLVFGVVSSFYSVLLITWNSALLSRWDKRDCLIVITIVIVPSLQTVISSLVPLSHYWVCQILLHKFNDRFFPHHQCLRVLIYLVQLQVSFFLSLWRVTSIS